MYQKLLPELQKLWDLARSQRRISLPPDEKMQFFERQIRNQNFKVLGFHFDELKKRLSDEKGNSAILDSTAWTPSDQASALVASHFGLEQSTFLRKVLWDKTT